MSIPVGGGGCCGPAVAVRVRLTRAARPAGAPGWAHAAGLPARRVQLFAAAERDASGAPSGSLGLWASWRLGRGRAAAARLELGEAYELRQTGRILAKVKQWQSSRQNETQKLYRRRAGAGGCCGAGCSCGGGV